MKNIFVTSDIDLEDLAQEVVSQVRDHVELESFILLVDEMVADYDFTLNLRNKLNKALELED